MSSPFGTDLDQLQVTTTRARGTIDAMIVNARELRAAVDFVARWQGSAGDAFRGTMTFNSVELDKLIAQLEKMAQNLQHTADGVATRDSDGAKQLAQYALSPSALTGAPLNT
jgi:uncharacterized protein YukE